MPGKVITPGQVNMAAVLRDVAKEVDLQNVESVALVFTDGKGVTRHWRQGRLYTLDTTVGLLLHEIQHEIMGLGGRIALPH